MSTSEHYDVVVVGRHCISDGRPFWQRRLERVLDTPFNLHPHPIFGLETAYSIQFG